MGADLGGKSWTSTVGTLRGSATTGGRVVKSGVRSRGSCGPRPAILVSMVTHHACAIRMVVEVERTVDPIEGRICPPTGAPQPFVGWLQLVQVLDLALSAIQNKE
ncbi:MAG: hypothetical protein M3063_15070 [Actinomycetota bacterium]|nr:hypothetical protein [Actinomycetota bacterium]